MRYLKRKRIENAGHPKGFFGRATLRAMNRDHDALTDWGLSFLRINGKEKFLDIGCGGGNTVAKLSHATTNTVWGVDVSLTAVSASFARNKKAVRDGKVMICKASVSAMPFDDEMFDIVTAVETVYFWPDIENDLKEVLRVMKHGAQLMIVTEGRADAPNPEKWAEIVEHISLRLPTADGLAEHLKNAGFQHVTAYIRDDALCVTASRP